MEVPIIISAAIFIAVIPVPSLAQYHGAHAVPWPLLLARGTWRMQRTPQYGHDLYGGQSYGDEFPHAGMNAPEHQYNPSYRYHFDASGVGELNNGNYARGNYLDNVDMSVKGQDRSILRRKRSPQNEESEAYGGIGPAHGVEKGSQSWRSVNDQGTLGRRGRKRKSRRRFRKEYDDTKPVEGGQMLGRLHGCPGRVPIKLNLKLSP